MAREILAGNQQIAGQPFTGFDQRFGPRLNGVLVAGPGVQGTGQLPAAVIFQHRQAGRLRDLPQILLDCSRAGLVRADMDVDGPASAAQTWKHTFSLSGHAILGFRRDSVACTRLRCSPKFGVKEAGYADRP